MTDDGTTTLDLGAAAEEVSRLARLVDSAALDDPTPCEGMTVRRLLDHLLGLAAAFRLGARKEPVPDAPPGSEVDDDGAWRDELEARLQALVQGWREPAAWEGETTVGGVTMPAAQAAAVALDELVLHGWDLARATDRPFRVDDASLEPVLAFTAAVAADPDPPEGLFGPPLPVPDDASPLDRALAQSGRDPSWRPPPLPVEEALRRIVRERVAAVAAKDPFPLAARQAGDVIVFDVLPPLRSHGSGAMAEKTRAWFDGYDGAIGYEVAELAVHGDGDVGFCSFVYHVTGTLRGGGEVDMWVRASLGCRRVDGRWLVVHDHESVPFDPANGQALVGLAPEPADDREET